MNQSNSDKALFGIYEYILNIRVAEPILLKQQTYFQYLKKIALKKQQEADENFTFVTIKICDSTGAVQFSAHEHPTRRSHKKK